MYGSVRYPGAFVGPHGAALYLICEELKIRSGASRELDLLVHDRVQGHVADVHNIDGVHRLCVPNLAVHVIHKRPCLRAVDPNPQSARYWRPSKCGSVRENLIPDWDSAVVSVIRPDQGSGGEGLIIVHDTSDIVEQVVPRVPPIRIQVEVETAGVDVAVG